MIRLDRLQQLADHLYSGQLGHKAFYFGSFNCNDYYAPSTPEPYSCGTYGCAIGECPIVWPNDWAFDKTAIPVLKEYITEERNFMGDLSTSIMEWFGLEEGMASVLFYPDVQGLINYGLDSIGVTATKEQVANRIEKFIHYVKIGRIKYENQY